MSLHNSTINSDIQWDKRSFGAFSERPEIRARFAALLTELVSAGGHPPTLLITAPTDAGGSVELAGLLMQTGAIARPQQAAIIDLTGRLNRATDFPPESQSADRTTGSNAPPQTRALCLVSEPTDDQALLYRPRTPLTVPDVTLLEEVERVQSLSSLVILVAGGVLDPSCWWADPIRWRHLDPLTVLACTAGYQTREIVQASSARLQRAGLRLAGGVLLPAPATIGARRWLQRLRVARRIKRGEQA